MSFWTHSKDVEFVDGKTAETKVGAINGITSDISGEADDIAASIKCVNELNASLSLVGTSTLLKEFSYNASGNVTLDGNISDYKWLIIGVVGGTQYFNPTMIPVDIFKSGLSLESEYYSSNRTIAQIFYVDDITVDVAFSNIASGSYIRLYGVK